MEVIKGGLRTASLVEDFTSKLPFTTIKVLYVLITQASTKPIQLLITFNIKKILPFSLFLIRGAK